MGEKKSWEASDRWCVRKGCTNVGALRLLSFIHYIFSIEKLLILIAINNSWAIDASAFN